MLFNSIDFAIFLPLIFFLYWYVVNKNLKAQNLLIAVASYVFYGWWDWRFLFLIMFSSVVDFFVGLMLKDEKNNTKRKVYLWTSVFVNLGLLGFFKYYNFFLDNFVTAFTFFGMSINSSSLNIILPVGISFYTFQTLSYTIDIYKKRLQPTSNFISFAAFVSFFPQLVAGPIERASNLLPQFYKKRTFDYTKAVDGMRQILWGLFKKVVIADNCAEIVNEIFNNSSEMNSSSLVLGVLLFAFQIYGDFSGYSDIAIGTARLFGFNLMQNFAFPYFSRSIPEFWKRWHISLTTWFRDYVFIPLVKLNPINKTTKVINVLILFGVTGFWHGASWNFIIWGLFFAVVFLPSVLTKNKNRQSSVIAKGKILPDPKEFFQMLKTFGIVVFSMIFFRTENMSHASSYIGGLFSRSIIEIPNVSDINSVYLCITLIVVFMIFEWLGREEQYAIEKLGLTWRKPVRISFYYIIIFSVIWFSGKEQEFIYFQF